MVCVAARGARRSGRTWRYAGRILVKSHETDRENATRIDRRFLATSNALQLRLRRIKLANWMGGWVTFFRKNDFLDSTNALKAEFQILHAKSMWWEVNTYLFFLNFFSEKYTRFNFYIDMSSQLITWQLC